MKKSKKKAFTGFGVLLLAFLAIALFCHFTLSTVQVSGVSMLPTLKDGQRVLLSSAYWMIGPIQRKDIVVIKDPGATGYIIKRVQFLGGEEVPARFVPDYYPLTNGPFIVPQGKVFVLGDNRPQSEDSRRFGPVSLEDIIGKVVVWR